MAPATACTLLPGCEAHPTDGTEKRFALRLTLADCNCQCTVVLYHELVLRAAARSPTRCTTLRQCACSCGTCSVGPSGFADSLSVKTIINKLYRARVPSSAAVLAGQRSQCCRWACRAPAESSALPVEHWLSRGTFEHAAGRCAVRVDLHWWRGS